MMNVEVCPLYNCCLNTKHHENCGLCSELPCETFLALRDPTLSDEEAEKIIEQMTEGALKPKPKYLFDRGDEVRVIDGPFSNFNGLVDEVNHEKGKVRVLVSIFGRSTPVELDFVQVSKI